MTKFRWELGVGIGISHQSNFQVALSAHGRCEGVISAFWMMAVGGGIWEGVWSMSVSKCDQGWGSVAVLTLQGLGVAFQGLAVGPLQAPEAD